MTFSIALLLFSSMGRAVFVTVYLLLLAGILCMPRQLLGAGPDPVPWWKNLRLWAALICGVQILVYGLLG